MGRDKIWGLKIWKPAVGYPVTVFEDPITCHKHEGDATIVKIHRHDKFKEYGLLDCDVRFKGESEIVRRQIKYNFE